MNVADIFHKQRRLWVRLSEKGGKFLEMPRHHTLEGDLAEYNARARLGEVGRVPSYKPSSLATLVGGTQLNGEWDQCLAGGEVVARMITHDGGVERRQRP